MNMKEIGEIRRRVRRDRSNMTEIFGCYVNGNKEIISEFRQSTGMMSENESDKYFGLMKKVLSGSVGKNLIDITFKTSQVADSAEHKLLMDLRSSALKDEQLRHTLYRKVIDSVTFEDNYLILLGCDKYDVPFKGGEGKADADRSEELYTYILCAVCPVKQVEPKLQYVPEEKAFHDGAVTNVAQAPELGFLFPAFDDRSTNIYNALYYTRSPKESHEAFVDAVFHAPIPKPAFEQKKTFEALLTNSLGEECSMDVVQSVHDELCQRIALHKESKVPEPLLVSKEEVKEVLSSCGVTGPHIAKFSVDFDSAFGFEADLHPKNIIDSNRIEVVTPDVSIKVSADRSDLIETRIIGGVKYILINAEEGVEVNGVTIHIEDKAPVEV